MVRFKRTRTVVVSLDGSLAQLVEQLTFNQLVAGSNPARPTIKCLFIPSHALSKNTLLNINASHTDDQSSHRDVNPAVRFIFNFLE